MFQISTGKFFLDEKKMFHDEKFVFYSNVKSFFDISIDLPKLKVEQIESGSVSCYVVSYQLITEEHPVVIKCGEQDFIQQFILIWAFFFDCIAKTDKSLVQKICREKKVSSYDQPAAREISPKTVQLGRSLEEHEIENFISFVNELVSTKRNTYKSIIASLKIIDDAKETLSTNFDLAYSTLVYSIESLSQKHDGYIPVWDDYHEDVKSKIEVACEGLAEKTIHSIKMALIEGKQFKLRKRFEKFILDNLPTSYYRVYLGENINTMRASYIQRCMNNLYQLRSSFVHELKPLDVMLSSPHSPESDYIIRFGEPYFTYSGLNRLIREVICSFVKRRVDHEKEEIIWLNETSSVIYAEVAPEHWIFIHDGFSGTSVNKYFSAYITMLNKKAVVDQSAVMQKITSIFDSERNISNKKAIIHYYWLYNSLHNKNAGIWQSFINTKRPFLGECIHFYIVILYLNHSLSYSVGNDHIEIKTIDLDEFDSVYESYLKQRFHKGGLSLPAFTEAVLLSAAANIALGLQDIERFNAYLNFALSEISSEKETYDIIESSLSNFIQVDINKLLSINQLSQDVDYSI